MNPIHKRRLYLIGLFAIGLGVATGLILYALKQNINVFLTPSQILTAHFPADYHFRLGGLVKKNSVMRDNNSLNVSFIVTDLKNEIPVLYTGGLPDLFREGKGMVAEGHLDLEGHFIASQVLAKHDENYMPKNVAERLNKSPPPSPLPLNNEKRGG